MDVFLAQDCALKRLENPCVYHIERDELYELDDNAFDFLGRCAGPDGAPASEGDAEFVRYCMAEGILKKESLPGGGAVRMPPEPATGLPVPSLRYLELQLTLKCNLRCRHCYIGPPEPVELPVQDIRRVMAQFEQMQGLRLILTGGEPMLHTRFNEINEMLPDFAFRKILLTNGVLTGTKGGLDILKGLNVHEVQVSIDGIGATHDALRGWGSYSKALATIRCAQEAGMDVSVATMVTAGNLKDFDDMDEMLRKMGVRNWAVDAPCMLGNLAANAEFSLTPERAGKYLNYGWGEGLHGGGGEGFACGLHLMSVLANGRCAKCAFYSDDTVGHIDEGLKTCWPRVRPIQLKDLQCDCEELQACRGGCRFRAALSGGSLAIDPYRCVAMGVPLQPKR